MTGKLRIFFSYAAGAGKTYAMLQAGQEARTRNRDIVLGYLEPHDRQETLDLARGLEQLPVQQATAGGISVREFDVDAALARRPSLILVDELAHTNADSCRNEKRWQDVRELLDAGIDVWTTLNVQHIESLHDVVASITGISVQERIPDSLFDAADSVELVDIEPKDLRVRLEQGRIYPRRQVQLAQQHFFTPENLDRLRQIALKRAALRVDRRSTTVQTDEHILVCLSASPTNPRIIRTAARMAQAYGARFSALYIQSAADESATPEDAQRLKDNMRLADSLGASVQTAWGEDVAFQISEYARVAGITRLVLGRTGMKRHLFGTRPLVERLYDLSPDLDIYIIPDFGNLPDRPKRRPDLRQYLPVFMIGRTVLVLAVCTLVAGVFWRSGLAESNLITTYILGVLVIAVITRSQWLAGISALVSTLLFSYLFVEPRMSFRIVTEGYLATFLMMFLAAFLTGSLAARFRQSAVQSARSAWRSELLSATNQALLAAGSQEEMTDVTARQLESLLGCGVIWWPVSGAGLGDPVCHGIDPARITDREKGLALWVKENNRRAGAGTGTLRSSPIQCLSMRHGETVLGVMGFDLQKRVLTPEETGMILAILGECALALENRNIEAQREQAALAAEKESLRSSLLRSVSHDLRTPLTAISLSADLLASGRLPQARQREIACQVRDDARWLTDMVENLLALTRIDEGIQEPGLQPERLDQLAAQAAAHLHSDRIRLDLEPVTVKANARLMIQVFANLMDNALNYAPGPVTVTVTVREGQALAEVADHGPGIPEADRERVFERFCQLSDAHRGSGLGLSLVRSILDLHDGQVCLQDNRPGARFMITMPLASEKETL